MKPSPPLPLELTDAEWQIIKEAVTRFDASTDRQRNKVAVLHGKLRRLGSNGVVHVVPQR